MKHKKQTKGSSCSPTFHASRYTFHERGYSLIELLVAIGLFASVVALMSSMFGISLRGQQKSVTSQNASDNVRYTMEAMAKEIRMGSGFTVDGLTGHLQFKSNMPNRNGARVDLGLTGTQIMFDDVTSDDSAIPDPTPPTSITSSNISISALTFTLYPPSSSCPAISCKQRVMLLLKASAGAGTGGTVTTMTVQTIIAPRLL